MLGRSPAHPQYADVGPAHDASAPQYPVQHYDPYVNNPPTSPLRSPLRSRHHPYSQPLDGTGHQYQRDAADRGTNAETKQLSASSVRRRISRACDQCNQLRTKCDGKNPCAHCLEFGLSCEYARRRKKRGKAARKDTSRQDHGEAGPGNERSPQEYSSEGPSPTQTTNGQEQSSGLDKPDVNRKTNTENRNEVGVSKDGPMNVDSSEGRHRIGGNNRPSLGPAQPPMSSQLPPLASTHDSILPTPQASMRQGSEISPTAMSLNGFSLGHDYDRQSLRGVGAALHNGPLFNQTQLQLQNGSENAYGAMSPPNLQLFKDMQNHATPSPGFRIGGAGESPLANLFGTSPIVGSPGWLNLSASYQQTHRPPTSMNTLRFPVLRPLLPYIESIIPISLACDLLELYFASSSTMHVHPISPHVLGYVFRKESFLSPTRPRICSPALLASMLWIAAQTSDSTFLTSPPSARGRVCQKLLEITVALLKPLVHGPAPGESPVNNSGESGINGVALGGLGVAMTGGDQLTSDGGAFGTLDNIPTYIHLASVVSASEYKAASLRWWNAAWTLARELKLGRELPPNPVESENIQGEEPVADNVAENHLPNQSAARANTKASLPSHVPGIVNEEEREERRRVWWLLYTVDRHLALCYNRPLFLLDVECEGLLQPMNDIDWQAGNFYGSSSTMYPGPSSYRTRGPQFLCTGHSIFGYFSPLMTILGYIVDLNQARNHPRFGQTSRRIAEWEDQAAEITSQLEAYSQSLKDFEAYHISNSRDNSEQDRLVSLAQSGTSGNSRMTDSMIQTKIVVAYGTHIMHVLHILITGRWDPINLLDDTDLWISTPSFQNAMGHAVAAAEAISDILEYDPDLSYMPFFFGVSLLQGGFLLLLTADKLAGDANPNVVRACENIIKAHEACIVTLNTEYQRHMRKVMRSALAQEMTKEGISAVQPTALTSSAIYGKTPGRSALKDTGATVATDSHVRQSGVSTKVIKKQLCYEIPSVFSLPSRPPLLFSPSLPSIMARTLPWLKSTSKSSSSSSKPTPLQPSLPKPSNTNPNKRRRLSPPNSPYHTSSNPSPRRSAPNTTTARSPSTSPPPAPPSASPMRPGLHADDIYIMVEDEFLSSARLFTAHLHHAEYVRLKNEAKARNASSVIARPVDGRTEMRRETVMKKKGEERAERVRRGVEGIVKGMPDVDDSGSGEEGEGRDGLPWQGTQLQRFMVKSPKRRGVEGLVGLQGVRANTRAAAGFERARGGGSPTSKRVKGEAMKMEEKEDSCSDDDDDLDAPTRAPSYAPSRPPQTSKTRPSAPKPNSKPTSASTIQHSHPPKPDPRLTKSKPPPPPPKRSFLDMTPLPKPPPKPSEPNPPKTKPTVIAERPIYPSAASTRSREEIILARKRRLKARKEREEAEKGGMGALKADEIPIFLV
ncbi:hypothetical protein ACLMJK_003394 [Lecanora helva]